MDLDTGSEPGQTSAKQRPETKRFVQETYDLGAGTSFLCDKALAIADAMEDEEILRKLSLSK